MTILRRAFSDELNTSSASFLKFICEKIKCYSSYFK
jgi:hypothetical protein